MSKGRVKIIIGAAAAAAVLAAAGMSLVITQQDEYKLIRQFGKVSRVIENAGVSLKIPFVEREIPCQSRPFCTTCPRRM